MYGYANANKRGNTDSSSRDGKRQRVDPTPRPPFMRMPEPWYPPVVRPATPPPPPGQPRRPRGPPPNPVPEHLRMKMPEPEDIEFCSTPGCTECLGPASSAPPKRPAQPSAQRQPPAQQNVLWSYNDRRAPPQNSYAPPVPYYSAQPPPTAMSSTMWWATHPNQNPQPSSYDARRYDPYRRQ